MGTLLKIFLLSAIVGGVGFPTTSELLQNMDATGSAIENEISEWRTYEFRLDIRGAQPWDPCLWEEGETYYVGFCMFPGSTCDQFNVTCFEYP